MAHLAGGWGGFTTWSLEVPDLRVFWTLPEGTEVMSKLLEPKYVEEGMAILDLFTFWRGWEHDVIVRQQPSKE